MEDDYLLQTRNAFASYSLSSSVPSMDQMHMHLHMSDEDEGDSTDNSVIRNRTTSTSDSDSSSSSSSSSRSSTGSDHNGSDSDSDSSNSSDDASSHPMTRKQGTARRRRISSVHTNNLKRCEQILECHQKIEYWTSRLEHLRTKQKRFAKLAQVSVHARLMWKKLTHEERNNREFIIAAFQSQLLPAVLEDFYNWSSFATHLRHDRDILLAFVSRSDFPRICQDDRFIVPPKLRGNKQVILAIIARQHLRVIEHMSTQLRDDEDVLMAVFRVIPTIVTTDSSLNSVHTKQHFLQHFSERIRSNPALMGSMLCSPGCVGALQHASKTLRNDKPFMLNLIRNYQMSDEGISFENQLNIDLHHNGAVGSRDHKYENVDHFQDHSQDHSNPLEKSTVKTATTTTSLTIIPSQVPSSSQSPQTPTSALSSFTKLSQSALVLKHASQRLKNDRDIVMAAVQRNGLDLLHASYPLRRDFRIVRAACQSNGCALKYCLQGSIKAAILADDDFLRTYCFVNMPSHMLRIPGLDPKYKGDQQLILRALSQQCRWKAVVPPNLQTDAEFCRKAVQKNCNLYLEMAEDLKDDYNIAVAAVCADSVNDEVVLEATERVPELLSNRDAMLHLATCLQLDVMQETVQFSPDEIRGDKTVMLHAIQNDSECFEYCTEELQQDLDIIKTTVQTSPLSLYLASPDMQRGHPDITVTAIQNASQEDLWDLYDDIESSLWSSSKEVVQSWLRQGGEWIDEEFNSDFIYDGEMWLAVIKSNWAEFEVAADELKADREFMTKAIACDGRVIQFAATWLQDDVELAVIALSGDDNSACAVAELLLGSRRVKVLKTAMAISRQVHKKLEIYDSFVGEFMSAILQKPSAMVDLNKSCCHDRPSNKGNNNISGDGRCHLHLLNQGPETSSDWTKTIASYLDIPTGIKLKQYRQAARRLQQWGF